MRRNDNLFGLRNMPELKPKIKIVVLFSDENDKDVLNEIRVGCNNKTCRYLIVPIHIKRDNLSEVTVKKKIRARASDFKNNYDKVYVIEPCNVQLSNYIAFDSINSFRTWIKEVV